MSNLTPSALPQGQQILCILPTDIPPPKFQLFQRVIVNDPTNNRGAYRGIITGMEYVDIRTALIEHAPCGWEYTISHVYGIPEAKAAQVLETRSIAFEQEITALEQE